MVTLLAKLFIRDHENVTDSGVRQAYGMLCGIVGIFFNLILFTTKALAGFFSHSIAITADAFNNLSDAASSIITLAGFKMEGQKPDRIYLRAVSLYFNRAHGLRTGKKLCK